MDKIEWLYQLARDPRWSDTHRDLAARAIARAGSAGQLSETHVYDGGSAIYPRATEPGPAGLFEELTFAENTELYMRLHRATMILDKIWGMVMFFGAIDAADMINAMSGELVGLLGELNSAPASLAFATGLS